LVFSGHQSKVSLKDTKSITGVKLSTTFKVIELVLSSLQNLESVESFIFPSASIAVK
jgi:hypothetical protein